MGSETQRPWDLQARVEDLDARLGRLRALGGLRRALRVATEDEEVARAAGRFTAQVLECAHHAVYASEKDDSDFRLLASSATHELPAELERSAELIARLKLREPGSPIFDGVSASTYPLHNADGVVIGFFLLGESPLPPAHFEEVVDELVFDVESALASRMLTRLRAEELAVLEIQERELVGLLRDVEARDAIIQRDLEEARQFQRQMLGVPPEVANVAIEVLYQPLGLVGGDLYAISIEGRTLRLFVADATGHGVRASLTTMFIKSGYEAVRASAADPASLLAALNDTIAQTYRSSEMLFSAVCVDLDLDSGRLLSSSAAHPPICLVGPNEATFIEGGGAFLGLRKGIQFDIKEHTVGCGDGVYLFTDGYLEARKNNMLFGEDRLLAVIADAHRHGHSVGEALKVALSDYLGGAPMEDDGALVGVRLGVDGPASTRIS